MVNRSFFMVVLFSAADLRFGVRFCISMWNMGSMADAKKNTATCSMRIAVSFWFAKHVSQEDFPWLTRHSSNVLR